MTSAADTVIQLRDTLTATLGPLLPRGEPFALLGYPAYANVGDSAIWLGALALLRRHGSGPPAYACTPRTFDEESLRQRVPRGTILFTGGGNFGDLYPSHQRMRERVVAAFPEHRIVQLPQTIRFANDREREASRRSLGAHRDFTLLARDEESLKVARCGLGLRASLCPDLAFALGPQPRLSPPTRDVLWLLRRDHEQLGGGGLGPGAADARDWPAEPREALFRLQRRLRKAVARSPQRHPRRDALLQRTFAPAARARVRRGLALLASARVVVTDRLHGHILATLLGIPHVFLDNSYGKNATFHRAWTAHVDGVRWAEDAADVAKLLEELR
ncbi:MAG: polysaccharide pyruvyl transferase family protein [Planctomycetota bacterium]|nr:polysaccharide pyruvyl transferase family protein [Planctomycetota bacterium]